MKKIKIFFKKIIFLFPIILALILFFMVSCSFADQAFEGIREYSRNKLSEIFNFENKNIPNDQQNNNPESSITQVKDNEENASADSELKEEIIRDEFFVKISTKIPDLLKKPAEEKISESFALHLNASSVFLESDSLENKPDLILDIGEKTENSIGSYTLAIAVNFYTLCDKIEINDFISFWKGDLNALECLESNENYDSGDQSLKNPVLVISEKNYMLLEALLGRPSLENIEKTSTDIEASKKVSDANSGRRYISVIGFEEINPALKILNIGGISIFEKNSDFEKYPLQVYLNLYQTDPEDVSLGLITGSIEKNALTNRKTENMASVIMTGCTALVRGTAGKMDANGILYPAEKIVAILKDADITHINNEITFVEGCTGKRDKEIVFCSKPEYIELLEYVGTDVVELTGNHMNDYGPEPMVKTLEMYDSLGWQYFGGGRNLIEAYTPALFEVNGNKIAFLGCNQFGPASYWATSDKAGAAPPHYEKYEEIIKDLRIRGYNVIFTFQHIEVYDYMPVSAQVTDFRRMAEAGANIVSGSQAHHSQAIEFNSQAVIFYGLGNLFFDQMQNDEVRQALITRHIFYEGKHINTVLITTVLEDYCQPRLSDGEERIKILSGVFEAGKKMAKK